MYFMPLSRSKPRISIWIGAATGVATSIAQKPWPRTRRRREGRIGDEAAQLNRQRARSPSESGEKDHRVHVVTIQLDSRWTTPTLANVFNFNQILMLPVMDFCRKSPGLPAAGHA